MKISVYISQLDSVIWYAYHFRDQIHDGLEEE